MAYFIRKSHFSLVELSLLAKALEGTKLPLASKGQISQENITQTLLKMKASEKQGLLYVAIHDSDPVGFIWETDGKVVTWIHEDHKKTDVESQLKKHVQGSLNS